MISKNAPGTFSLLSIGQRGVGKTVFMAGSYAELHGGGASGQSLWFDCRDSQSQQHIENVLGYVRRTGNYPPPTMKITHFDFSLKRRVLWHTETLCHFRWRDIPGEICSRGNTEFQQLVNTSQGCCVFIDASRAVSDPDYLGGLEEIFNQVMTIASMVYLRGLKYAFAIVLTKCDLLGADPGARRRLDEGLQPLIARLEALEVSHQTFQSCIPLEKRAEGAHFEAVGGAAPILWLVWELSRTHQTRSFALLQWLSLLLPSRFRWLKNLQSAEEFQ